jgi:2-dehydro-3-deoxyphosphogluconate aldolase / (4S)-4-hydroxy-2-oxoglutarate aldolase
MVEFRHPRLREFVGGGLSKRGFRFEDMKTDRAGLVERLVAAGVIAVVRAPGAEWIPELMAVLIEGGVTAIEITLSTPDAFAAIRRARREYEGRACVGVGTVLTVEEARLALEAGAQYVVTPVLRCDLVPLAHAAGVPIMLGAYTPTEAQAAHETGADFVKLFPADRLGPEYVRALRAPLPHLRIVPTGGVDADNAGAFLRAGCAALGAGSSLVPAMALRERRWGEIRVLAERFSAAVREARGETGVVRV